MTSCIMIYVHVGKGSFFLHNLYQSSLFMHGHMTRVLHPDWCIDTHSIRPHIIIHYICQQSLHYTIYRAVALPRLGLEQLVIAVPQ